MTSAKTMRLLEHLQTASDYFEDWRSTIIGGGILLIDTTGGGAMLILQEYPAAAVPLPEPMYERVQRATASDDDIPF